jgi:hypothetical protein
MTASHLDGFGAAIEGAVHRLCGRPEDRNPYCEMNAPDAWAAWAMGWAEAHWLLEIRGEEETRRWLNAA